MTRDDIFHATGEFVPDARYVCRCDMICSDEASMVEQVRKYFEAVSKP